jgi:transposase-like protein
MAKINNEVRKEQLALHLASGGGVADWARAHGIPDRTVYTWSRSPEVRDRTEAIRRAVLAEAVQQLGAHAAAAAGQIVKLAENARSETVRLQAARAVLAEFMSVANYTSMAGQLADIERRLRERAASSAAPVPGIGLDLAGPCQPATDDEGPLAAEDDSCSPC